MPFATPRNLTQQGAYNRELQTEFDATRRVAPSGPGAEPSSADSLAKLKDLADLHAAGSLTDEEFSAAKAKLLGIE